MTDRSRYSIVPIGSLATGWGLKVDGVIQRSHPRMVPLAAYVDALVDGATTTDADFIAKAVEVRPWPPSLEERAAVRHPHDLQGPSPEPFGAMPTDPADALERILGEADALIRRRLIEAGLEVPHLAVAVTPAGQVVLRSNVSPDVLASFGKDLIDLADTLTAPKKSGETEH